METSGRFSLDKENLKKVGIGSLVAMGGALLTYLSSVVAQSDFGLWSPVIVAGCSILVNIVRKFLTDYSK